MTIDEKQLIDEINLAMQNSLQKFIGDPISPCTILVIKSSMNKIFEEISENYSNFCDHVDIEVDEKNTSLIHFHPKANAPLWVIEVFMLLQNEI